MLFGTFAGAIWKRVEQEGDRAFFYSESLGVSQWKRPEAPQPSPIGMSPPDLRGVHVRWSAMSNEDRLAYTVGSLNDASYADSSQLHPHTLIDPHNHRVANVHCSPRSAPEAPRLPLLSAAARNQGAGVASGKVPQSILGPPSGERAVAYAEAKLAAQAADLAREARAKVLKPEDLKATSAEKDSTREPSQVEKCLGGSPTSTPASGNVCHPRVAAELGAAASSRSGVNSTHASAQVPPGPVNTTRAASSRGRHPAATAKQIENRLAAKCAALRADEEERAHLRERVEQSRAKTARQNLKDTSSENFVVANATAMKIHLHACRARRATEIAASQRDKERETFRRYECLLQDEMDHAIRTACMPAQTLNKPAQTSRHPSTTLHGDPGIMFSAETAKGRARRLASRLAHLDQI